MRVDCTWVRGAVCQQAGGGGERPLEGWWLEAGDSTRRRGLGGPYRCGRTTREAFRRSRKMTPKKEQEDDRQKDEQKDQDGPGEEDLGIFRDRDQQQPGDQEDQEPDPQRTEKRQGRERGRGAQRRATATAREGRGVAAGRTSAGGLRLEREWGAGLRAG